MMNKQASSPHLPGLLSYPFALLPEKMHSRFLVLFLNQLLSVQIEEGELDFFKNRCLSIKVENANITYHVSFKDGRFIAVLPSHNDLMIQAKVYDFLMLAARQEDPDTLVFQRRLIMQGDTELGLELKNFLDGLDIESTNSFALIESVLQKSLPVYRRLFS